MRHRLNGLNGQTILEGMAKATLATLAMGLCLWAWLTWTQGRTVWLVVSGGIVVGVVVFAASIALLGVSEFKIVLGAVKRRFAG
jgi:peptidoglycan biosynthesis protein MviN/MurJ (putative lipid II flippase)